ncbi:MAG: hypothetical protein AB7T38_18595 [Nitrospirales bacterium]
MKNSHNLFPHTPPMNRAHIQQGITFLEQGYSGTQVETALGIPQAELEQALVKANQRQKVIRAHLQNRGPLSSLLRYPDRGPWGKASYFGNCPGYLIVDLLDYLHPQSVFDPMEGSGTTGEVCFDFGVEYVGKDLKSGFDLLTSDLPTQPFDLIFWHPPYWPGKPYSEHPNDFSTLKSWSAYLTAVQAGMTRLCDCLSSQGHLAILIGDGRRQGRFYPIHSHIIEWQVLPLEAVLVKTGDHERRANYYRYGPTKFIPTRHEYLLLFTRKNP